MSDRGLPIVTVADHLELPEGALKSVDAIVAKSEGPHLLLATIHSVLQTNQSPQHAGVNADQSTPGEETKSRTSKRQILVVDDAPSVRESMQSIAMLLISARYDIAVAEDGFGALAQLRKTLPVVVLSDLRYARYVRF